MGNSPPRHLLWRSPGLFRVQLPISLLDLLEVGHGPTLVEVGLSRRGEAQEGEPALLRHGWDPVRLLANRGADRILVVGVKSGPTR